MTQDERDARPPDEGRRVSALSGLRRRLRESQPFLALFSIIAAPEIVELAAAAGFDGIILDTEHGSYGTEHLPALILAARAGGIFPIMRVRCNDAALIGAALDAGASGVLVPQIGTPEEAARAIGAARFAPQGSRGANPWVRAGRYGFSPQWFETANSDAAVLLMIEGPGGMQSLDAILALPHLDGVFVGPVDLSHSLGVPGQITHTSVRGAVVSVIQATNAADVNAGVFAPTEVEAARWLDCGARFVAVGVDTAHIGKALQSLAQQVRAVIPACGPVQAR